MIQFTPALVTLLWRVAGYAAIALALAGAYAWWAGHQRDIGRAEVQASWDAERATQTAAALKQAQANAAETQRRLKAQKDAQHAHDLQVAQARADAAAAGAAADRLYRRVAALTAAARGAASHPAPVGISPPAGDPIGVLADVLSRADARAGLLAQFADAAHAAGNQCQREYEALNP